MEITLSPRHARGFAFVDTKAVLVRKFDGLSGRTEQKRTENIKFSVLFDVGAIHESPV